MNKVCENLAKIKPSQYKELNLTIKVHTTLTRIMNPTVYENEVHSIRLLLTTYSKPFHNPYRNCKEYYTEPG
jgi:hypothetical protein